MLQLAFHVLGGCLRAPPLDDAARAARVAEMYAAYRTGFSTAPDIDVETLQARLDAGEALVLVDVRTDEERAVSMLPNAIPAETVDADPAAYVGQPLVAYCTIGVRSGRWTEARRRDGLDVTNLAGSVLAWTYTGRALQGPDGETRRVHVYGRTWDLARTDYPSTW